MVSDQPSVSLCNEAASRQMELTRPFHDRRVVEFGLAVPEDLYVRDGWNRYLARTAMKDLYPPEFATRWRRNDDQAPDFHRCVKELEGVIGLQLDRLASDDVVSSYVDIERIRKFLAEREINDHNSGWEQETQLAVLGLLMARFVEWFKDDVEPRPAPAGKVALPVPPSASAVP
jgi:asparagine synthase (glutamine-hydrolysing)